MGKRIFVTIALAAVLAVSLCACGQQGASSGSAGSTSTNASSGAATGSSAGGTSQGDAPFATMQDVFDAERTNSEMTYDESRFITAFSSEGQYYRVVVDLPEGMKADLDAAMFDSDKLVELLGPLAVTKTDVLEFPTQAELDSYVGKTGAELADDGFVSGSLAVNGNETDCSATKGSFDYLFTFDGAVEDEDTPDAAGAVKDMTVTAVGVQGISWAALIAE